MLNFSLQMAWGSGRPVTVGSLPLFNSFHAQKKTEHGAISVLTHSYCVFLFSPLPQIEITLFAHTVRKTYVSCTSGGVGFPSFVSNNIPCQRFVLHILRCFSSFLLVFTADEVALWWSLTTVWDHSRGGRLLFNHDIHPSRYWLLGRSVIFIDHELYLHRYPPNFSVQ